MSRRTGVKQTVIRTHAEHPEWSVRQIAEAHGYTQSVVRATAWRCGIKPARVNTRTRQRRHCAECGAELHRRALGDLCAAHYRESISTRRPRRSKPKCGLPLTAEQRADYVNIKRKGFLRAEALRMIGRADLVSE
jgi:hypothetical protein